MKKFIMCKIIAILLSASALYALQQNQITIAVLTFEAKSGVSKGEASTLSDRLRSMLVARNIFIVLERGKMNEVLEEQGFQQTGCTSTECVVEAGKLLNVQKMVSGSIGKLGQTYTIDLSLINVETAQIEKSFFRNYKGEIDGLLEVMESITNQIIQAARGIGSKKEAGAGQVILTVDSSPPNAIISINNLEIGRTPYTVNVNKGEQLTVDIKKEHYKIWSKKLILTEDKEIKAILTASSTTQQQGTGTFSEGKLDGERTAKGNVLWVPGGAVFTLLAIGYAYFSTPSPPTYALVGKSAEYVIGFTEGYQSRTRTLNTRYACLGCAATVSCIYFSAAQGSN